MVLNGNSTQAAPEPTLPTTPPAASNLSMDDDDDDLSIFKELANG